MNENEIPMLSRVTPEPNSNGRFLVYESIVLTYSTKNKLDASSIGKNLAKVAPDHVGRG